MAPSVFQRGDLEDLRDEHRTDAGALGAPRKGMFLAFLLGAVVCIGACSSDPGAPASAPLADAGVDSDTDADAETDTDAGPDPSVSPDLMGGAMQGHPLALTGTATTFAGADYEGIGQPADGTGLAAKFCLPSALTTDGSNLYVADCRTAVRKVVIATGEVTTLAGRSSVQGSTDGIGAAARFDSIADLTTDGKYVYVVDSGNDRNVLRRIDIATGEVTTINATFAGKITFVTTDNVNLYVADQGLTQIWTVAPTTGEKTVLAKGIVGSTPAFGTPAGVTTDGALLYLVNGGTPVVSISIATGTVTPLAGNMEAKCVPTPIDGSGTDARFCFPMGITSDGTSLYVPDMASGKRNVIRKIAAATGDVTTASFTPVPDTNLGGVTTDGKSLFVTAGRRIIRIQ